MSRTSITVTWQKENKATRSQHIQPLHSLECPRRNQDGSDLLLPVIHLALRRLVLLPLCFLFLVLSITAAVGWAFIMIENGSRRLLCQVRLPPLPPAGQWGLRVPANASASQAWPPSFLSSDIGLCLAHLQAAWKRAHLLIHHAQLELGTAGRS